MNQYVKRTQRDYTLAFKLAVVEQIEAGEVTYKQAQARYGIQGRSTYFDGCTSMVIKTGALPGMSKHLGATS